MKLNPLYALGLLYFFANIYAFIVFLSTGELSLDGRMFQFDLKLVFISLMAQCLILFLLLAIFNFGLARVDAGEIEMGWHAGFLLLLTQAFYLVFSLANGLNIAGSVERPEGVSFLHILFILIQPDLLFVIIVSLLKSNRLFWVNVILFALSMAMRGWMGSFIIVLVLILIRYRLVISVKTIFVSIPSLILTILALPFLVEYKWMVREGRGGGTDAIQEVFNFGYLNKLGESLTALFDRFQHLGHVSLTFKESELIYRDYMVGKILPYWLDGMPQVVLMTFLRHEYPDRLNNYLVANYIDVGGGVWNTHPGLAGWLLFLQWNSAFLVLYIVLCLVLMLYIVGRYGGRNIFLALGCFSLMYLFHGWFGAFFNMVFYSLVVVTLCKLKLRY